MHTKISTKGQVVIPGALRRRLDIRAGDYLDANITGGRIILTPRRKRLHRPTIVKDPLTGLPALTAGPNAPILTSKIVADILASVPD
jgi:AbrB family looped-hinge helix DNA binding protein